MKKTPQKRIVISLILIGVFILAHFLYDMIDRGSVISRTALLMGTIVEIKVPMTPTQDKGKIDKSIAKAIEEIRRVESVFSVFKPDSEISRINNLGIAQELKISDEAFDLIAKAVQYNKKTGGAFDITVKPLVDLWKACGKEGRMPYASELEAAMKTVGCGYIHLDASDRTIAFKKDGVRIDLGGIAKGYATDRAIKVLIECGITSAIVNSGGDMYCLGRRHGKEPWKVGIQHPRKKGKIFMEIGLTDKAIDTSGDYEKYFIINDKRYSHIIDPRSGYPIGDTVVSATVVTKDSTTADILATALCVLGESGFKMLESGRGEDAMIVLNTNGELSVKMTEGFKTKYAYSKENSPRL